MIYTPVILLMGMASAPSSKSWSKGPVVTVYGQIEYDTVDSVRKQVRSVPERITALELDSWGGDGAGGLRLAEFVNRWDRMVVVTGKCNSACSYAAIVALGQGKLWVGNSAQIGVHQVYDNATREPDVLWTRNAMSLLRQFGAKHEDMLQATIDTPPSDLTYFSSAELQDRGAHLLPGQVAIGKGMFWTIAVTATVSALLTRLIIGRRPDRAAA